MRSSDWSSDVCSSDLELGAFDDLRRLTAGGVGHAEVDALGAHRLHGSVAEEGLRRRQPDELDALLLRVGDLALRAGRSEEHTSELQSLMRISYAVFCLKHKPTKKQTTHNTTRSIHPK